MKVFVISMFLIISTSCLAAMDGVIQKTFPGCQNRDVMMRAVELADQKDYAAADAIFERGFKGGECRVFVIGENVIVESREMRSGLSLIHLKGSPEPYWVINETVDPPR